MTHRTVGLSFSAYAESTVHAVMRGDTKKGLSVAIDSRVKVSQRVRVKVERTKVKECK